MTAVFGVLNGLLGGLFDLLLLPFRQLHPMIGLTLVSALCSVGMLLGYRATSNQPAVEAVKRKIAAGLFEIRLFNDDLVAILRAQGSILRHNMTYLGLNMVPMAFMIVPFVLVIAQLQFHYGYEGLRVDEATILEVEVAPELGGAGAPAASLSLELPDGLAIDAPRVWMPTENRIAWRLVAERPGVYDVAIDVAGAREIKRVVVSDAIQRRSPSRLAPGFVNQLLYPAEPALPHDGPVRAIELRYPEREVGLLGFETHWLIVFFILTIALAFAMKGLFGVTI